MKNIQIKDLVISGLPKSFQENILGQYEILYKKADMVINEPDPGYKKNNGDRKN